MSITKINTWNYILKTQVSHDFAKLLTFLFKNLAPIFLKLLYTQKKGRTDKSFCDPRGAKNSKL